MEKERDYIDNVIKESFKEIEPKSDFNSKLMNRINRKSSINEGRVKITAASFILSGFLAMFLYTSNAEFRIIAFKYKIESQVFALQYNYSLSISKIFLGE